MNVWTTRHDKKAVIVEVAVGRGSTLLYYHLPSEAFQEQQNFPQAISSERKQGYYQLTSGDSLKHELSALPRSSEIKVKFGDSNPL